MPRIQGRLNNGADLGMGKKGREKQKKLNIPSSVEAMIYFGWNRTKDNKVVP